MTTKREMKDKIYDNIAILGKAMASPKRLEILALLLQGEKSVEILANQTDQNLKLTSAHLKALKQARLVTSRRDSKHIFYRIANDEVGNLWVSLRSLAEQQFTEIQKTLDDYFDDRDSMIEIDRKSLVKRVKNGDLTVIDVRPEDEFISSHIPHALSIPLSELKRRLMNLPKDREVVAYCRGPYCVLSHEAVKILKQNGFKAHRISDGVSEWAAAGLPLERGRAG